MSQPSADRYQIDDEPLIPPEEAAADLHVEPQTLAAWRTRNQGPPYFKIGKLIFYKRSINRQWVDGRIVRPTGGDR